MTDQPTKQQLHTHIGQRLRRRRSDLGLSLEAIATAAGVSFQQASQYEAGAAGMSAPRLRALGLMLGVSPAYFYRGLQPTQPLAPLSAGS